MSGDGRGTVAVSEMSGDGRGTVDDVGAMDNIETLVSLDVTGVLVTLSVDVCIMMGIDEVRDVVSADEQSLADSAACRE